MKAGGDLMYKVFNLQDLALFLDRTGTLDTSDMSDTAWCVMCRVICVA